ncbi:MAG: ATP synthase F1 subunit delta [Candidatus Omnitrophica bacterium]|jgi:ATP synthase F1 delta subunit|nr:ATP synthase F1 subunit delta [Candidatus Omnitrophota bacterium]MDD5661241.1 ATP synthase F1 subunit delta [Candidatus Omnitrophota bacterium]
MLIQLLIIQLITFVGIIFLLRYLFSNHLKAALGRLNTLHEENLAKEEELNEELKRAKEESQAQINQGKAEAELIVEEANKEAQQIRINMEEQAKLQATEIVVNGRLEAEKIKASVIKDVQGQSVELASKMIAELLTETDKIALQYEFANGIIQEISQLSKEQFNMQGNPVVKVTSSFTLLDRQRDEIKRVLSEKTGKDIEISEQIDASLIGGLTLEMGGMVIDGTLKNKLQRIIPHLK